MIITISTIRVVVTVLLIMMMLIPIRNYFSSTPCLPVLASGCHTVRGTYVHTLLRLLLLLLLLCHSHSLSYSYCHLLLFLLFFILKLLCTSSYFPLHYFVHMIYFIVIVYFYLLRFQCFWVYNNFLFFHSDFYFYCRVYNKLIDFIRAEYWKRGYQEVSTYQ